MGNELRYESGRSCEAQTNSRILMGRIKAAKKILRAPLRFWKHSIKHKTDQNASSAVAA